MKDVRPMTKDQKLERIVVRMPSELIERIDAYHRDFSCPLMPLEAAQAPSEDYSAAILRLQAA
jgi:hypothetical protein